MAFSVLRTSALRAARFTPARSFSTSMVARKDLIQDLYLSKLKEYKPPAKSADAHLSAVKAFTAPQAPQAPTLPSDLAAELSKFDSAEPTFAQAAPEAAKADASGAADGTQTAEEYLAFLEKDLPKAEVHH